MEGLIVLLVLALLAVPVLLIVALVSISGLKQRMAALEAELVRMQPTVADIVRPASAPVPTMEPAPPMYATTPVDVPAAAAAPAVAAANAAEAVRPVAAMPPRPPASRTKPSRPSMIEVALRAAKHWLTAGNVPVKIGMLVLLAGVAALLKYASDQGWMVLPPAVKLAAVAMAALGALVFAWRKRESNRSFALSLQGGAIGVLLLVVFAAFKRFDLLPASAAFALSIALVAGAGMLAVLQSAMALAVFALLAGFLAPLWLSTGSGSHVALFSYYAVLNAAIVAIAWFRAWRLLNLLGFAFTFGIGSAWGLLEYEPAHYRSSQLFLLLFFAFYLAIPLLFARKRPAGRRDLIDGCLIFGMPLLAFTLQAGLLEGAQMPLALCALGLGALYALLASALRTRPDYGVLLQAYALLAVGFATLAVPLALSAKATASVFALEGAGLVWLGLQRGRRLPQFSGAGLQLAAALAFAIGVGQGEGGDMRMLANPTCMGALLIAVAGFASAWAYRSARRTPLAGLYYGWALLWWLGNGLHEVMHFLGRSDEPDALLAFAALSGWLAAEVHRRRPAAALGWTALGALVVAAPLALWQVQVHQQPFGGHGWLAWLLFALVGVRMLVCLREGAHRVAALAQFCWWLLWPMVASLLLAYVPEWIEDLGDGWDMALIALPWLALAALALRRWGWLTHPLGVAFDGWRSRLLATAFAVLGLWWLFSLWVAGAASPLPWLPLLNPLELAQLATLVLLLHWQWPDRGALPPRRIALLAGLAFVWISSVVLHAVHHWGDVPWDGALLRGSLAQTSLSITWSVLGVFGWVLGSRRGQRQLWQAGAILMGVVLAKLVFIDRTHLGNLLGIGSFIAYGLLCTVVGYLAPAPPRSTSDIEEAVA